MRNWTALLLIISGCSLGAQSSEPNAADAGVAVSMMPPGGELEDDRAQVWFSTMCASCHGERGEGASAPSLQLWTRPRETLIETIDQRMPLGSPERCDLDCATRLADFILDELQSAPPSCDTITPPPRSLRLLTRREYNNTVRDLFPAPSQPCNSISFTFDPAGRTLNSVWVSGAFNNWATTLVGGAWPMSWDATQRKWTLRQTVPDGTFAYKLVLNGTEWVTDPSNAVTTPDGFGGQNSMLHVSCAGSSNEGLEDYAANFPLESRPPGYAFDNNSASLVTAIHVTEMMAVAERLATRATRDLAALLPCSVNGARATCAETFVRDFGRRVFRRPLSGEERARFEALIAAEPTLRDGVEVALRVMLASPAFLYRAEMGLDPWETASALSYLLLGTMPDAALMAAAERGVLSTPDELEREARRLLEDPRARETFGVFAQQWLGIEKVLTATKHATMFPDFNASLRRDALEETTRFVNHVVFDGDGTFPSLFLSRSTFVNARLARHYGITGVTGDGWVEKMLPPERIGVLSHTSVMASYAHSDQSSPIKRGVFVREQLLCQQFGVPPPDAGGLPEVDPDATTRERFRMHTDKESCRGCHQYIDGVGFGFERFDAIGRLRDTEAGHPIDASGNLNDVEGLGMRSEGTFSTLPELAAVLAESSSAPACFAKQYLRFARGTIETAEDRCGTTMLVEQFRASGFNIRELMIAYVRSPLFVERR